MDDVRKEKTRRDDGGKEDGKDRQEKSGQRGEDERNDRNDEGKVKLGKKRTD